jgi:hypothetical protein
MTLGQVIITGLEIMSFPYVSSQTGFLWSLYIVLPRYFDNLAVSILLYSPFGYHKLIVGLDSFLDYQYDL